VDVLVSWLCGVVAGCWSLGQRREWVELGEVGEVNSVSTRGDFRDGCVLRGLFIRTDLFDGFRVFCVRLLLLDRREGFSCRKCFGIVD
jgi:hypothetical protein